MEDIPKDVWNSFQRYSFLLCEKAMNFALREARAKNPVVEILWTKTITL